MVVTALPEGVQPLGSSRKFDHVEFNIVLEPLYLGGIPFDVFKLLLLFTCFSLLAFCGYKMRLIQRLSKLFGIPQMRTSSQGKEEATEKSL